MKQYHEQKSICSKLLDFRARRVTHAVETCPRSLSQSRGGAYMCHLSSSDVLTEDIALWVQMR